MSLAGTPVDHSNISNLRDIMSTYNKMTDICFQYCISNLNYHNVTKEEESCINKCSSKYINGNNRVMGTFMEVQTTRQKAMIEEAEQKERDRMAGKSVDDTPNLPGPASAANLLFNTPRGPEGAAAQPPPGASS